jgi:ankyrin repeat domain-containing protein 50
VIEFLEKDLPFPDTGLAFIYCNYKERLSQKVEYFVGTIVRQLVEQRPAIPEEVRSLYEKHRGKGIPLNYAEYLELLQSLATGCSEVYIVIDALDECIGKDGESIWSSFLIKLKASVPNLHLLCTSRHISDPGGSLAGSTHIEIRASDADIKTYVLAQVESKDRLLGFCGQDAVLRDEILEAVGLKAEGM